MPKTGVNNKLLKQKNRGLLLKLIATGECSSRIELAQKTGLAKMTVSNIVNEFLESGMLEEREKVQTEGKGRNPILSVFHPLQRTRQNRVLLPDSRAITALSHNARSPIQQVHLPAASIFSDFC